MAGHGDLDKRISVRRLRLRASSGALHTIPMGGIDQLTSYSRDWGVGKLKFRVPFDTAIAKVKMPEGPPPSPRQTRPDGNRQTGAALSLAVGREPRHRLPMAPAPINKR